MLLLMLRIELDARTAPTTESSSTESASLVPTVYLPNYVERGHEQTACCG
jgi:hypothetical protein